MRSSVNNCLKDPTLIKDERLRSEVKECILADDCYSPLVDNIRRRTGLEYEFLLHEKLRNFGIVFLNEEETRKQGKMDQIM